MCLNEQISLQSDSLFAAIRQLQDFQVRVSETIQTIHSLQYSFIYSYSLDLPLQPFKQNTQYPHY